VTCLCLPPAPDGRRTPLAPSPRRPD